MKRSSKICLFLRIEFKRSFELGCPETTFLYVLIELLSSSPPMPMGHVAINGHWPYMAIFGHMAIGPNATNMGKLGIPEKMVVANPNNILKK